MCTKYNAASWLVLFAYCVLFYMFITIKLYILCSYSCLKSEIKQAVKEELKKELKQEMKEELKVEIVKDYNREREERRTDLMETLDKAYLECPICLDLVKNPQECANCKNLLCLGCVDGIVKV